MTDAQRRLLQECARAEYDGRTLPNPTARQNHVSLMCLLDAGYVSQREDGYYVATYSGITALIREANGWLYEMQRRAIERERVELGRRAG